jgi:dolichol-phosphate mannosyltransferase
MKTAAMNTAGIDPADMTATGAETGVAARAGAATELSVVVPVYNEHDNIAPLVAEIVAALRGRIDFEIVYVDDCSSDASAAQLGRLVDEVPELRVLRHAMRSGQSAAIRTGVRAARGTWIATLDGDGQNDPADIPRLLALRDAGDPQLKLITGWRTNRRDTGAKRLGSRFANAVRRALLRDDTPDTGCGTKLFDRQVFLELPAFDHMHRRQFQVHQPATPCRGHRRPGRRGLADAPAPVGNRARRHSGRHRRPGLTSTARPVHCCRVTQRGHAHSMRGASAPEHEFW